MTPTELYRDLMELSEIARLMQAQGIRVDTDLVRQFSADNEKAKDLLFPYELRGSRVAALQSEIEGLQGPFAALQREKLLKKLDKYKVYKDFNPRSATQIEEYFAANGVELRSTEKKVIQAALLKAAAKSGLSSIEEIEKEEELPGVLQNLYNLYVYKDSGKGLDPWFGPKYLKDGFVYPRFSVTGTSTGRLSSSKPNFQNVASRGFGEFARRSIIARSEDLNLVKADFSNLEFRVCLYLAGTPYTGGDAFKWLLERTGSAFFDVAKKYNPSGYEKDAFKAARDYAKSAVHACVTGDHEVLTPDGWVRIDSWNWNNNKPILIWDKTTKAFRFEKPQNYYSYANVETYRLYSHNIDIVATENHKIPILLDDGSVENRILGDFPLNNVSMCRLFAGSSVDKINSDLALFRLDKAGRADVYCFTTSTGYFVIRRKDRVSITGNSDYLEGFVLLDPRELGSYGVQKALGAKALRVMTREHTPRLRRDWTFFGKIVAFSGANFAERIFGRVDLDTRRQALEIQEDAYMANFWDIREWQIRVLEEVERTHMVRSPTGRFLRLLGMPQDIAKVAIAFLGQGVGADHASGILLRFWREQRRLPILYVHDELVFEMPKALDNRAAVEYIRLMEGETNRLPGFTCPVEIKRGPNWKDMDTIWKDGEYK